MTSKKRESKAVDCLICSLLQSLHYELLIQVGKYDKKREATFTDASFT